MTKLESTIKNYQFPPYNMDLRYIPLINEVLSQETKEFIEKSNLDLRILAILIRDTLSETEDISQIDTLLWNKLHDQNIVIRIMGEVL